MCWNYENDMKLAKLLFGIIGDERDFLRIAEENFTPYYHLPMPCANRLRRKMFTNGGRWRGPNRKLYLDTMEILQEHRMT